jgi:nucleoside-diphosphate-sugar epimerase
MTDAILVTGATGFVGTHLVAALRREGRSVLTHSSADGDIARCALPFDDAAHVVHLAGRSFVPDSWESPRAFYDVNVVGTVNVLEFCRRRKVPLTYVSSYVYGIPRGLPIGEDHPVQASNPYSHSKILAEESVRYFVSQFGVQASIVRPFNVYGPHQDERFIIPTLVRQALDPDIERITVRDLRPKRDFIHVRDLVSLLIATLTRPAGRTYKCRRRPVDRHSGDRAGSQRGDGPFEDGAGDRRRTPRGSARRGRRRVARETRLVGNHA